MTRRMRGLDEADRERLERRATLVEARTGAQVVVCVTPRSDAYPEVPWKAFSLGVAAAAPAAVWLAASGEKASVIPPLVAILAAGLVLALAAIFIPSIGRLLVGNERADREVRQQAGGFFLERELFRTRERDGILLLASLYERRLVLLADARVRATLGPEELARPMGAAIPLLSRGRTAEGLLAALEELEAVLLARGFAGGGTDEIAEELIVDPEAGGDR